MKTKKENKWNGILNDAFKGADCAATISMKENYEENSLRRNYEKRCKQDDMDEKEWIEKILKEIPEIKEQPGYEKILSTFYKRRSKVLAEDLMNRIWQK